LAGLFYGSAVLTWILPLESAPLADSWKHQRVLFGALMLFAFLLASFPARNLDFWVHLADGRDLVRGLVRPRPGFLFDLIAWAGTLSFGGSLMVLFKALVVVATARNILRLCGNQAPWIAALGTGLAVLAMSNRLLLQPLVISLFLCSVITLKIWQPIPKSSKPGLVWILFFAFWALVDSSYWMGAMVIISISLGDIIDGLIRRRFKIDSWVWLGLALSGLGVWLGVELSLGGGFVAGIAEWSGPEGWYRSPFGTEYWMQATNSPAGLAFFPLAFLSVFGFISNINDFRWSRMLPWAVAGIASCLNYRLIPWFALFAGPIFASGISCHFRPDADQIQWNLPAFAKRSLAGLRWGLLGLFLICVWPGWLQLPPYGPRALRFDPHPSWEHAGNRISGYQAQGLLPEKFSVGVSSRGVSRALSWFHPEIQWEYLPELGTQDRVNTKTDLVLALDPDRNRCLAVAQKFFFAGANWQTVTVEESFALFSRKELGEKGLPVWDPDRLAFASETSPRPDEDFADSPIPEDHEGQWYRAFFHSTPGWKPWRDYAEILLLEAEFQRQRAPGKAMRSWVTLQSAAAVASPFVWAVGATPLEALFKVQMIGPFREGAFDPNTLTNTEGWVLSLQDRFGGFYGEINPGSLLLAIRALRRESLESPGDGLTRKLLGEAYHRLVFNSKEKSWGQKVPGLSQLRRVQAARALAEAVRLSPELPEARLSLGLHFQEVGYRDLAFEELRMHQALLSTMGIPGGIDSTVYLRELRENGKKIDRMEEDLRRRKETFVKQSASFRVFDRAQMAMEMGLAGVALNTLLSSDISAFGAQGMDLELQLLLFIGAAKQVRDWAGPEAADNRDLQTYHWTRIQSLAALGQYGSARKECEALSFPSDNSTEGKGTPRQLAGLVLGQAVLEGFEPVPDMFTLAGKAFNRQSTQGRLDGLSRDLRGEAEGLALAGIFALEEGRIGLAKNYFEQALSVRGKQPLVGQWDFESRTLVDGFLELIRRGER